MGKVMVAYPKALSFSSQTIDVINILPCAEIFQTERKKPAPGTESPAAEGTLGASPPPGAAAIAGGNRLVAGAREVIVESTFSDMVEYLAGVWVTSKLYEVFEDSKLAEFSARAMHLEGSLQKVEKEYKKVQHRVFKAVHEAIDKGMRECFSAKMIKEKKKTKKKVAARRRDIDAAAA
jgi:F0F1-type ATP synthase gamma subunit